MEKENIRAYFAWITICIVWGTTYLAIRIGVEQLPPMLFAGLRWIIAGVIFLSFLKIRGHKLPARKDLIPIAIVGIALIGVANGLVVVAEQWIPSGLASLLITTLPFWIVGLESFLPVGPKFNYTIVIGLLIGLSGVSIIFGSDIQSLFESSYLLGIICLLGAVVSWSLGTLYSKYKKINTHPLMAASLQMLIAGVAQSSLGILLGELPQFHFTQSSFLAFCYLAIVGSIIGYSSYIYAISHLPISLVSTYTYINPIIALILGWLILDEKLNFFIAIAAVLIFIGVSVVKMGSNIMKDKSVNQSS